MTTAQVVMHGILSIALLAAGILLLTLSENHTELGASIATAGVLYATGATVKATKSSKNQDRGDNS